MTGYERRKARKISGRATPATPGFILRAGASNGYILLSDGTSRIKRSGT